MSDQASTIMVNTLEPQSGTTLTVGKSGQNLQVNADSLKANVAKDAGGNAIFTSDGSGSLSGLNSGLGSAQTLIQSQTADDSASISFTSGIDGTYKHYVFELIRISPAEDAKAVTFQCSTDGGSNYNTTLTSTSFRAYHMESDTTAALGYASSAGNSTAFRIIAHEVSYSADSACVVELHLFNPSSTTYVKNWYSLNQMVQHVAASYWRPTAGYFNTTSAINAIQFKMSSGNFDGIIKMYGVK